MDMFNPNTYIWTKFLLECKEMIEEETGQTYEWEDVYPRKTQKQEILDKLFIKHASLEDIILRNKILNEKKI